MALGRARQTGLLSSASLSRGMLTLTELMLPKGRISSAGVTSSDDSRELSALVWELGRVSKPGRKTLTPVLLYKEGSSPGNVGWPLAGFTYAAPEAEAFKYLPQGVQGVVHPLLHLRGRGGKGGKSKRGNEVFKFDEKHRVEPQGEGEGSPPAFPT